MKSGKKRVMKKFIDSKYIFPLCLLLASFLFATFFIWVGKERPLSSLEEVLLQFFTLGLGLWGSALFGKYYSQNDEKRYCRSAFRRLYRLLQGMLRMQDIIESTKDNSDYIETSLACIEENIITQIQAIDDALEDWNAIIPDAVNELKQSLENRGRDK